MSRTKNQQMADQHEAWIKEQIQGHLTKGSGNQWHAQLDSKNGTRAVPFPIGADGKATLGKSLTITQEMWAKLREQCFGEIPTWWGRFYRDETLRTTDLDLVALEAEDFRRILEAARKWEDQQARLLELGMGADISAVSLAEPKPQSSGRNCCR